jgi:hypothetical protein
MKIDNRLDCQPPTAAFPEGPSVPINQFSGHAEDDLTRGHAGQGLIDAAEVIIAQIQAMP